MAIDTAELLRDAGLLAAVFFNWLLCSALSDFISAGLAAKKVLSLYIAAVALAANSYSLLRSVSFLGSGKAPSETLTGMFAEIVNLAQLWGALFACARYFSLDDGHAFMSQSLMHSTADSIFEMSMTMAGVGYVAAVPTTVAEYIVVWFTAYVGGVLCTNLFLLSVVLGRRGYWERGTPAVAGGAPFMSVLK